MEDKNEAAEFVDLVNTLGAEFENLCLMRHEEGQDKYGKFTFLGNDVTRMMIEELADTVNYCRYQAVKLLLLQTMLENELEDKGVTGEGKDEITIGVKAFKGVKDVGWKQ